MQIDIKQEQDQFQTVFITAGHNELKKIIEWD